MVCAVLLVATVTVGCWRRENPISFVRPVKVAEVRSLAYYEKEFAGRVVAREFTNLAFPLGGQIVRIGVAEGSNVVRGQEIARLDPADMNLQLEAERANYQTKQSIMERNERLLSRDAISLQEVEISRAELQAAKSAYEYALSQLSNTVLVAPFAGSVERRYVEQYQQVSAGEPIVKLINPDELEVTFVLPENDSDVVYASERFFVTFDNHPDLDFEAALKESVNASVNGAGVPVTLAITDARFSPLRYNVKAGFACRVKVVIDNAEDVRSYVTIPLTALFSPEEDDSTATYVWVFDSASATVHRRRVTTDGLTNTSSAIIRNGLSEGELVVTAGVFQLVEGQKVSLLNR